MSQETSHVTIQTPNGVHIYYETRGTGEPLLLLHGFSGSSQDWKALPAKWATTFRLIIPDLRGHGRSGILAEPFRHQDAAADIIALLDHLEIPACSGIGVSAGGNVLLHLATQQPTRIQAMVLVSATPYFPPQARAIMRRYPESVSEAHRSKYSR